MADKPAPKKRDWSWRSQAFRGIVYQIVTVAVLGEPDIRERFRQQGVDADPGTPAQLAAHINAESARFEQLIRAIGLKPE